MKNEIPGEYELPRFRDVTHFWKRSGDLLRFGKRKKWWWPFSDLKPLRQLIAEHVVGINFKRKRVNAIK